MALRLCFVLALATTLAAPAHTRAAAPAPTNDAILDWNAVAIQACVNDHSRIFGAPQQGGPTRSSRALAIVHIAMYDALVAIDGSFDPYNPILFNTRGASKDAAIATAAYITLAVLYPAQTAVFQREYQRCLVRVPVKKGRAAGVAVGTLAALNILWDRQQDGAAQGDIPIYPLGSNPPELGDHQLDPLNPAQGLLTPGWGQVDTFSGIDVTSAAVRIPPPPALNSPEYTAAYNDVLMLGGDGVSTPTLRTAEQTQIGIFWAYDGTIGLGTPPVLYNQVMRTLALQKRNTLAQNARLFALGNIAMADAGIACWDSKYYHFFWRPVIGIRTGALDGNSNTFGVSNWTPLGAPASNRSGTDFTPPFPAYSSGHATFGAAVFRILQRFYGTDAIAFTLKSDELNGRTTDSQGNRRPAVVRRYTSFSQAAIENARSRIYLGIHWQFDADAGIAQGNIIADRVFNTLLLP